MHPQDMLRDLPVSLFIRVVCHHEEKIETGQKGIRKGDVPMRVFVDIILVDVSTVSNRTSYYLPGRR